MRIVPTNRSVNGLTVRVTTPNGDFLNEDTVIELDELDYATRTHYQRAVLQGDMKEFKEIVETKKVKGE